MLFVLSQYWPFIIAALVAGAGVGWWLGATRRGDMSEGGVE